MNIKDDRITIDYDMFIEIKTQLRQYLQLLIQTYLLTYDKPEMEVNAFLYV